MKTLDYNNYAEKYVQELKVLQDIFQKEYDLNSYTSWFYNQSTGLLTFSKEGKELNFEYMQVGSFSQNSGTWKWSWDNEETLANVKEKATLCKEFGEHSNFLKLTEGCFVSDEVEAWEFTAIALRLAKGIGVYRPLIDEQLQLFLVITAFVEQEVAQSMKDKYVECSKHKSNRIAFCCQHILTEKKVGFEELFETYEDMELDEEDDLWAWCDACELQRQKEEEWNDNLMAFSGMKIICERCYFEMKEINLGKQ